MEVKKRGLTALSIALVVALVVAACGRATPTSIPTSSPGLQTPLPTQLTPDPTPTPIPTLPVPPTDPAPGPSPGPLSTPGYAYDDELGYGFDYPGGWEMQVTLMADLEVQIEEDIESILMFTKPGTPTTLIVTVTLSDLTTLEELKVEFREAVEKLGATIFEQTEITASGREGYEVIYSPFPSIKMRQVMFIANGKSYMITCSTAEQLYDEYEETFDSIMSSFTIE